MADHKETLIVHETHEVKKFGAKEWPKQQIILTDFTGSETRLKFLLLGDNCEFSDGLTAGDEVAISFHLEGREWKAPAGNIVFFTDLVIDKLDNMTAGNQVMAEVQPASQPAPNPPAPGDDVPF